ncbi:muscle M-line assembly protein unc-89-like isoform X2 [Mobula hypostoma]|uniref:muscle M-line assembly protein unc-89-like isoform X2 n=1 Tax=Mobula hypostoma TaxID=723540 RepID=UPI002FC2E016
MQRRSLGVFLASFLISAAQPQTFRVLVSKSEVNAVEGDAVTLSVRPSFPVVSGFWKFRSSSIVTWTVEPPYLNVAYTKRNIDLLFNTSLLLWSVGLADSGVYWITVDSRTGKEATANITLNVFPKPVPFTIVTESAEINVTEGNTIQLKASPSEKVKNGSWQLRGKVVAQWNDIVALVNTEYQSRAALFNNCSLQLKSASVSDTGEYKVSMSTDSGDTSTANILLNVFPKSVAFTIVTESAEINATEGNTIQLKVSPSEKVKNGSWQLRGKVVAQWNDTVALVNAEYQSRAALFNNCSLQLKSASVSDAGEYKVSMSTDSGDTSTANILLNVFPKPVPFTIVTESAEINATEGNTIQLKVTPSEKVKKGSWQMHGKEVAQWNDTVALISTEYQSRAALFHNCSLQLKSASVSDTGEYTVSMSTDSGDTSTTSILLNVFQEAQPLKVTAELSQINAEITAEVLLSVRVSGEVKNGSWSINKYILFKWSGTIPNITFNSDGNMALLPNASLLIPFLHYDMDGVYSISLTSPAGMKATTNLNLHIFVSRKLCEVYNSILALLVLLMLMLIVFFTVYIQRNHPKNYLQKFDLLVIFFKGYRTCLSIVTMVTFVFIILIAVSVTKESCVLGQQPVLHFVAS